MPEIDAATLLRTIGKAGLLTPTQIQESRDELGDGIHDSEAMLRHFERKGALTSYQIDKLQKGDVDGFFLGGYRIQYKIASGTFGRVFRADDVTNGRIVAIKVLRRRWSEDAQVNELFDREAKLGMTLRHPNIVEILNVGRDPNTGQHYLVMEFVEGGNLRDVLAIRKKFEPADALPILEDIANALHYAYMRGITHRDLKLSNVLLSSQGSAKLVDFGLAQIYATQKATFRDEDGLLIQRTVDYAGLEKLTGVETGDTRSDIYFLGCIAYEIMTGRPPAELTRDRHQRMRKDRYLNVPPIRPEEINGPISVIRLVESSMALDPKHRPQTPTQLLEVIRQVRAELDPNAAQQGAAGRGLAPTVFVVEKNERLQDAMRDRLKEAGYRVLIASSPERAIERFSQQPYPALIVDAGSTQEEGIQAFKRILFLARERNSPCQGILILNEDQADYANMFDPYEQASILVRPLNMKGLLDKLRGLIAPT
jgi:CheY-like chemotaxis protein/predicted Ser/Thr protein kinase